MGLKYEYVSTEKSMSEQILHDEEKEKLNFLTTGQQLRRAAPSYYDLETVQEKEISSSTRKIPEKNQLRMILTKKQREKMKTMRDTLSYCLNDQN